MKKIIYALAVTGLVFTACKKDVKTNEEALELNAAITVFIDTIQLPQVISSDMLLTPDHLYIIKNKVYVKSGTLIIQAGTHIEGVYSTSTDSAAALVITKTGRISAKGAQSNPIIFTSHLVGLPGGRTVRQPGDWGGIIMLGDAPTNRFGLQFVPGLPAPYNVTGNVQTLRTNDDPPPAVDVSFSGGNENHDGGVMTFVRCEYAGAVSDLNNELNSFTFAGVGKKTGLRYLMASYGADDAFEFFGGNVAAKYLVANAPGDDAFDFTYGYTGDIQFGFSVRNPALANSDAQGIESDNEGTETGATRITRPVLSNFTIIGSGSGSPLPGTINAGNFIEGTDLRLRNSIFIGYNRGPNFANTKDANTPAFFRNNIVHAYTDSALFIGPPTTGPWGLANRAIVGAVPANVINVEVPATHAAWKSSAAVYQAGGQADPAAAGAVLPNFAGLTTNFLSVPYIGALGPGSPIRDANGVITIPNNWVAGSAGAWVNFDPL